MPQVFWVGVSTLFVKECLRFLKVSSQTLASPLINAALYLVIFGVNFADRIVDQQGVDYLRFIIPGLIALSLVSNAFQNASGSIIVSKFHGDLQDLKVVPLNSLQIILAYSLAATVRGALVGTSVGIIGQLIYFIKYDALIPIEHPFFLLGYVLMGGITFGLLGLSVALFSKSFDQINAVGSFLILPLIYLGGVFFSIQTMSLFWQSVAYANPMLYLINGIRYAALGISDISPNTTLLVSLGLLLGAFLLARLAVRKGDYSRF